MKIENNTDNKEQPDENIIQINEKDKSKSLVIGENKPNFADPGDNNDSDIEMNQEDKPFDLKDTNVRLNFIRKVYLILCALLCFTAVFVLLSCFNEDYRSFIKTYELPVIAISIVVTITLAYVFMYVRAATRKVPLNYFLLFLFTFFECLLISSIVIKFDPQTVGIAAILTGVMSIALTVYACTTKTNLTILGGIVFVGIIALIFAVILNFFFQNKIFEIIISYIIVIVYSIFLIYDTQLIVGNGRYKLSVDDYIFAALMLFIDIITIFVELLKILGSKN